MENGNKLRLLYIYQYLLRHSDAEHPVSTPELLKYLKDEYNMDVHRTTVPNDFAMMDQAGIHFKVIKSRQNKYYYDDRPFDVPELKLLIDAVSSSKFITEKKSKELIGKLVSLTSDFNAEKLRRHITVEGRIKSENDKAISILDSLNEAIDRNCKVSFQYADYNNRKRKELRHDGEYYIVSPYALVWDGDFYYMIGYCDNRDHMRHFRLDRIFRIPNVLTDEQAVPAPKDFNLAKYIQKTFRMYGGDKTVHVELLCETFIMNAIVDHFGKEVPTEEIDDKHFKATVTVSPSPTFYRWVFGWNGAMKILGPESVKNEYKQMIMNSLDAFT